MSTRGDSVERYRKELIRRVRPVARHAVKRETTAALVGAAALPEYGEEAATAVTALPV
jgi:hypothetical protein